MRINKEYILLIIGTTLISMDLVTKNIENKNESNKLEYTIKNELNYSNKKAVDIYDMVLEIPQINLRKGIYQKQDNRNNINQNVTIHEYSDYPNQDKSNVILMAHSGTGSKAYFNNLNKLDKNSLIKIYYNHKLYTYKINNSYKITKTGKVELIRDKQRKTITLITCDQKDKTKQLIYIGYLIDEI